MKVLCKQLQSAVRTLLELSKNKKQIRYQYRKPSCNCILEVFPFPKQKKLKFEGKNEQYLEVKNHKQFKMMSPSNVPSA